MLLVCYGSVRQIQWSSSEELLSCRYSDIIEIIKSFHLNGLNLNVSSTTIFCHFCSEDTHKLRCFETVFHFPLQLNFMKGLLVCSKRLLLLVDSRCCNKLSTYQLLYSHWHFGCHGNLTGPQIHPISSIPLHFTQKVVGKLPFLLPQNCLHIKEHFLRKFKKILSGGFGATLIFCNIKVGPKPLESNQSNGKYRVYFGLCIVAMETKFMLGV